MTARRAILNVGYSILGAGMGVAVATNMMDELPDGLGMTCISVMCVGLCCILAGRRLPKDGEVESSGPPPESPGGSN